MRDREKMASVFGGEIIAPAWKDDVCLEVIEQQRNLNETDVIALIRRHLKRSSFRFWRKRVTGRQAKRRAYNP
jgi:uncharacterized protein (TIGR03643 family)